MGWHPFRYRAALLALNQQNCCVVSEVWAAPFRNAVRSLLMQETTCVVKVRKGSTSVSAWSSFLFNRFRLVNFEQVMETNGSTRL